MLLDTSRFRIHLEQQLEKSTRFLCYSAFFTEPAAKWFIKYRKIQKNDCLLVRALPDDFINGSCSFDAIRLILDHELSVRRSPAFHAKVYAFDDIAYIGSANLTAKGLALIDQHNQELGSKVSITSDDVKLLENLWNKAEQITLEKLDEMEKFCEQYLNKNTKSDKTLIWPKEIFNETHDIYCSDFPQDYPSAEIKWQTKENLQNSSAYIWLKNNIQDNGSMSFGALSASLHNTVCDDPTPYRRDIKFLLNNLLSIVMELDTDTLKIIRPFNSQIVEFR